MHMNNIPGIGHIVMTAALLVSACDNTEIPAATQASQPTEKSRTAKASTTPNAKYITGAWCLTKISVMSSVKSNPNIPYIFNEDGTLQYQTSSDARIKYDGSWKVDGDRLFLMARPLMGSLEIRNIEPNSFVLDFTVQYMFQRGPCAK
jgi:hypothetical protein